MKKQQTPAEQTPLRAICYHRCSTDEQDLEAQRRTTELECEREGWAIVDRIDDQGWSAKDTKRPGLQKALAMLSNHEADVLVVAKLDRLSRSVYDFIGMTRKAKIEGWNFCIKDMRIDTTHPNGKLILIVLSALSEWEREMIGLRTKEALAVKKSQGVVLGRKTTADPKVLKFISDHRDYGSSYAKIAKELDEAGLKPPEGGATWRASSVRLLHVNAQESAKT